MKWVLDLVILIVIGIVTVAVPMMALTKQDGDISNKANNAIQKCEQSIPRNQSCEIHMEARVKK